jgi:hypothetical protein
LIDSEVSLEKVQHFQGLELEREMHIERDLEEAVGKQLE